MYITPSAFPMRFHASRIRGDTLEAPMKASRIWIASFVVPSIPPVASVACLFWLPASGVGPVLAL